MLFPCIKNAELPFFGQLFLEPCGKGGERRLQKIPHLARSFAGESQAGMRYQLIAKLATAEEYPVMADTIRSIAKNETYHAKTFFDTLVLKAGSQENIDLNAGYPFHFGTLTENLGFAADDERAEFEEVYPAFAMEAREEGFEDVAALFERVLSVEKEHEIVFRYLRDALRDGTLYKRDKPTLLTIRQRIRRNMMKNMKETNQSNQNKTQSKTQNCGTKAKAQSGSKSAAKTSAKSSSGAKSCK